MRDSEWQWVPSGVLDLLSKIKPVLNAFANDEEVALDQTLDDLTVSLLLRAQFAGCGHRLAETMQRINQILNVWCL